MKLFIFIMVVVVTYVFIMEKLFNNPVRPLTLANGVSSSSNKSASAEDSVSEISVTIEGEVNRPAKYKVTEGIYLYDLIEIAGGLKESADKTAFTAGVLLEKNETYYIAPITEETKISLNTGTIEEFQTLAGIGVTYATRMVEYRASIGMYQRIEQIKNISGIGTSIFNRIKDRLCL